MATNPKMKPCPKCGSAEYLAVYDYDGARYVECNNGFNTSPSPCLYRSHPPATSVRAAIKFHNQPRGLSAAEDHESEGVNQKDGE